MVVRDAAQNAAAFRAWAMPLGVTFASAQTDVPFPSWRDQ